VDTDPATRLVFTSREPLPQPFARRDHEWELGALHRDEAVELVGQVMQQHGWTPPATDTGTTPEEITALVEAVHGHPRALVLLARETAERGVRATTAALRALMADLDRAHQGPRAVGGRGAQHVEAHPGGGVVVPRRQPAPVALLLALPGAAPQGNLKARAEGIPTPVYALQEVHHAS
jgi:hypothetical protein